MGLFQNAEGWLFKVAAKKVIVKAVAIIATWLTSGIVAQYAAQAGVTADPLKLQEYMTATALAGLKALEDYVNLKYGTNL